MAVVLTSTTSPQNELEHGVSEDWRNAEALKPVEEAKPEVEQAELPLEPEVEAEPEKPKEQPKGHKSGWQKRIDKLTARNPFSRRKTKNTALGRQPRQRRNQNLKGRKSQS